MDRTQIDGPAPALVGRERELAEIEALLAGVQERGRALVVGGEAGIGKSAILDAARSRALERGFQVLTTGGIQCEARLAFAALHLLIRPVLSQADALPPPQRNALHAAFGMTDAAVPDLFLVGLATLNLLVETATHSPLLIVVDDAQWLDAPTGDVLTFVARRLESDPIILLAAVRDSFDTALDQARLPHMKLAPLEDAAAGALLQTVAPDLTTRRRDLILAEAAGNPLALIELPSMSRESENPTAAPWLPLTARLEEAFTSRIIEMPLATRTLLLAAAVEDRGSLNEILRAASAIESIQLTFDQLVPAVSARLVTVDGNDLSFHHPLVRSAVLQAASGQQRREAHQAFADTLGNEQADRRAWHRAASITEPNEAVASELEAAAMRARQRGGLSVSVSALERASQLTSDVANSVRLSLLAAEIAFEQGRPEAALRLMDGVRQLPLARSDQARLLWLDAMLNPNPTSVRALLDTADGMRIEGHTDLALRLVNAAAMRCFWAEPGNDARYEVADVLERIGLPPDDGWVLLTLAYADPIEHGAAVRERLSTIEVAVTADPLAMYNLGTAAAAIGEYTSSAMFLDAAIKELRQKGHLALLGQALAIRAWAEVFLGNLNIASSIADEARTLAEESGQVFFHAAAKIARAASAALQGDVEFAESLALEADAVVSATRTTALLAVIQFARGFASLAAAQYEQAYDHLHRLFQPSDPAHHFLRVWVVSEIAEAALHSGHGRDTADLLTQVQQIGEKLRLPWLLADIAYARALFAEDDEAEALYRSALEDHTAGSRFVKGRLKLAYGSWLRRHRRVVECRPLLRESRDILDAMGAIPWAERARAELRAAGESSTERLPQVRERLTPQELQIAHLAAQGLSNRQIGQQLFLSPRTVGAHLYHVFPKLGISSRSQLSQILVQPL